MRLSSIFARSLAFVIVVTSAASAYETGAELPRPDQADLLVQPRPFSLPLAEFSKDTQVVVFFYSASWCAPCKQIGAQLKASYLDFKTKVPDMEFVTFSVDFTTRGRADYLREQTYPWPALAPTAIESAPWKVELENGTPQFQAFALTANKLKALTAPGEIGPVIEVALQQLEKPESSNVP